MPGVDKLGGHRFERVGAGPALSHEREPADLDEARSLIKRTSQLARHRTPA